jgi:Fe-S-cluster containining protein
VRCTDRNGICNRQASFGHTVSCRKGCGVCCCQMVPLSPPEAAIIADVVDQLPPARKKTVLTNFAKALDKLDAAGLKETISNIYSTRTDKKEVLDINRKYFELGIPCPFLAEGSCSIHPHRPSRCREYSVLSSADFCKNPFDNRIKRLPLTIKLCESLSHAWSSLTGKAPNHNSSCQVFGMGAKKWRYPYAQRLSVPNMSPGPYSSSPARKPIRSGRTG